MERGDTYNWPSWLEELRDEQPLQLPPAYFRQLLDEVMQKVSQQGASQRQIGFLEQLLAPLWQARLALGVGLMVVLAGVLLWTRTSTEAQHLETYVLSHLDDFEEQVLYDVQEELPTVEQQEGLIELVLELEEEFLIEQLL